MPSLLKDLQRKVSGQVTDREFMRRLYATDASEYQELPLGVAFPATENDVREIILFARHHRIPLIPRTAGTSLAGQVVGNGLIVDMGHFLNNIVRIDKAARRVVVQPGVVRDALNLELARHGLIFGPETSTANRAMIGGMVGNNSCGSNSIIYGNTRDHLVSARGFFSDGTEGIFHALTPEEFHAKCREAEGLEGHVYRTARHLLGDANNRRLITENFPLASIPRRNTGYALDLLMDASALDPASKRPFNFCQLLAGSEGTLFFGMEFELSCDLLPPPHAALVCGHFHSVDEALRANLVAVTHAPSACELIDRHILECTKSNLAQQRNRSFVVGDPRAILVVEIRRDNEADLEATVASLQEQWQAAGLGYAVPILRGKESAKVWELRRAGQGLMSNVSGDAKPREVVEDTAVDVHDLPGYIREFDALLKSKYGIECVYYAHAGSGELHTRPLFNLKTPEGLKTFRGVATDIAHLVKKYRGSLSGEHGDGRLRGEFIPLMVGKECYDLMRSIKEAFDPDNIFNPGKIIDTPPMDTHLRYSAATPTPDYETVFDFGDVGGLVRAAEKCNGSGDCLKSHLMGGSMCPSYQATREEKHTTRGRANMLRQMLTNPRDPDKPFDSPEIKEALDLCLSCKACKSECPSSVDMTRMKAEFFQHYYDLHGVPLRARMIAHFSGASRLASLWPWLYNRLFTTPLIRRMFNRTVGFHPRRTLPKINPITFHRWFKKHRPLAPLGKRQGRVHLFCDEFTNYNDLSAGIATVELLELLGYEVHLPTHTESGRASLSKGLVRRAAQFANKNVRLLANIVTVEEPLIGIEPSAILSFRDEYPALVEKSLKDDARKLAPNCLMLDEFLEREAGRKKIGPEFFTDEARTIHIQGHCHQKSLGSIHPTVRMLSLPKNYTAKAIPSGCCGMAGSFGYEKEHYDVSMDIGELVLFPAVRTMGPEIIISSPGTSCRHQISDGTGRTALHPAEVLRAACRTEPLPA